MLTLKIARQLLDTAGGGDGTGGGGDSGNSQGAGQNGSGGNGNSGNQGSGGAAGDGLFDEGAANGDGGSGGNGDKGDQGKGGNQGDGKPGAAGQGNVGQDWKSSLPDDLKNDAFLTKYPDLPSAMRGFKEAQKMIGAEKIAVPPKGTALEQMGEVFQKLGLPQDIAEYKFDLANQKGVDPKFLEDFKQVAHAAKILPAQAKVLMDHMIKKNEQDYLSGVKEIEAKIKEGIDGLRKEWGDAYNQEMSKAKAAMNEFLSKDEQKLLRERGYGKDPLIIKLLNKVGGTLSEDKIRGESEGGGSGALTAAQAQAKITELTSTVDGPYFKQSHPEHLTVKKQVAALYKVAYPGTVAQTSRKDLEI